jgi:hypothetical protein
MREYINDDKPYRQPVPTAPPNNTRIISSMGPSCDLATAAPTVAKQILATISQAC